MKGSELLGRDDELAALRGLVDRTVERGQVLVLIGEPGIGKTELLRAAGDHARAAGHVVLSTTGVEAETELPFSGLHQLVRRAMRDAGDRLPIPQRAALKTAFGDAVGPTPDPYLIALGVLALLEAVAAERPALVVLDDVQWLDGPSHDALAFVARRLGPQPVSLLAAARAGHPGALMSGDLPMRPVPGLAPGPARRLLAANARDVDEHVRGRILDEALGNPLALVELPAAWRGRPLDQSASLSAEPDAELPLTARLERAFAGRSARLSAAARNVLLVMAVAPDTQTQTVRAAAALMTDSPPDDAAIEEARAVGLVDATADELLFRHPLVGSGILQHESMARRQAAHGALATVLVDDPHQRAWHNAMAIVGPDDAVADELAVCAAESAARGAAGVASTQLRRAAELTSSSALRGNRLLLAAQHAFSAGRPDAVATLVEQAALQDLAELDQARLEWLREIFHDGVPGDALHVLGLCRNALRAAGGDGDLALDLLLGAALRCWWADTGPDARARTVATANSVARAQSELAKDPRWLAALAVADPVGQGETVQALLAEPPFTDPPDGDALRLTGMAAHAIGDTVLAVDLLERARAALAETGRLGLLPHVLGMHHHLLLELGELDRATEVGVQAARLAVDTRQPIWTTGTLATGARELALRGEVESALKMAERAAGLAGRQNDHLCCALLATGVAHLAAGRADAAYEVLARTLSPSDPAFHWRESYTCVGWLAEAAVCAGQQEDARRATERMATVSGLPPAPILAVNLLLARALLAADGEADRRFAEAHAADLSRWPGVRARLALAEGRWLCRTGRSADGWPHLAVAADAFAAIGMTPWAKQARRDLSAAAAPGGTATRTRPAPEP